MCNCIDEVNTELRKTHPGCSVGTIMFIDGRVTAALTMVDGPPQGTGKRKVKAPQAIPTYCPFCGQKYKASKDATP
jgi:hypothetical protein